MDWKANSPVRGDIIRVKIGSIYHYGIFVSDSKVVQFGPPPVSRDNKSEKLVLVSDIDSFCLNFPIEVGVPSIEENKTRKPAEECVKLALSRVGEGGYNVLHNNCEHFANECYFGRHFSFQEEYLRAWWRNRKVCSIYFSPLMEIEEEVYPPLRQKEIDKVNDPLLKKQKYTSWKLLLAAIKQSYKLDKEDLNFTKDEFGKWKCNDFYLSISHAKSLVMVALSSYPIGVDLEEIIAFNNLYNDETKASSLKKKIASNEKEEKIPLLQLWLEKEAHFKAYGEKNFNPSFPLSDKPHLEGEYQGYAYSIYGDNLTSINCYEFKQGKLSFLKILTKEKAK